jgi:membrane protein implicated in regulation of membrane protease activity
MLLLRKTFVRWMKGNVGAQGTGQRGSSDVGQNGIAKTDFVNKRGTVEYRGSDWQAQSADEIKAGDIVVIDQVQNITLHVSKE